MRRPSVLDWSQAAAAGPGVCGGKGWNLGRLHRYGFRVPAGGVLAAEVYTNFLAAPALQALCDEMTGVAAGEVTAPAIEAKLTALRSAIVAAPLPEPVAEDVRAFLASSGLDAVPVAVRSSATAEDSAAASFAGIHSSVLNVRGAAAVLHAIKQCYASLWTQQAVAYRRRLNLTDEQVACAVVICAMVPAAAAGVAFSCDPRTGRRDLVTINAVRGLGDTLMSGRVNPQEITVSLAEGQLKIIPASGKHKPAGDLKEPVGLRPLLAEKQVLELARLVQRTQWAVGEGRQPQDVEWVHDGERYWLVQVRPVTRLPHWTFPGVADQPVIWSNANVKDVIPGILSELGWNGAVMAVPMVLFGLVAVTGYTPPTGMELIRRFAGRAYFDLTALQWMHYDIFGVLPDETNRLLGGRQPEIRVPSKSPRRGGKGLPRLLRCLRLARALLPLPRQLPREMARYFAVARALKAIDPSRLTNHELCNHFYRVSHKGTPFAVRFGLASAGASVWAAMLQALLERLFPMRGTALLNALSAGCGGVTSAEHGYRLAEVAAAAREDADARAYLAHRNADTHGWRQLPANSAFRAALERFLADFGHRAVYEAEIANPRWNEDPSFLLDEVRRRLDGPPLPDRRVAARATRATAETELRRRTWLLRPLLAGLLKRHRYGLAAREAAKSTLVALFEPARLVGLEIGRRLVAAGQLDSAEHIFDLSHADLEAYLLGEWDGRGARERSADARARVEAWLKETPPDVIIMEPDGRCADKETWKQAAGESNGADSNVLIGVGVATGRAAGRASIVRHPGEAHRLENGAVLLAPSTDPGWTPLFLRAAAVVMETGGYLSHGAIVAREYGIPAVVNVPGLLDRVQDGQRVQVDGDAGRVTLGA